MNIVEGEWDIANIIHHLILIGIMISIILIFQASAAEIPFNESIAGDRNLGQYFTFTMDNVTGTYAHARYHYTVYDYRIIGDNFTYYSISWGQWFKKDAAKGKKYLAIWVRGWMEGTSYFGWASDRFSVFVNGQTIGPEPVLLQDIPLGRRKTNYEKLNEEVTGRVCTCNCQNCTCIETVLLNESTRITRYTDPGSTRYQPATIAEIQNRMARNERGQLTVETYGWKDENQLDRMNPGYSERFDGWILYQIPKSASPEDMSIAGNFRNFGTAIWHLTDRQIDQESIERQIIIDTEQRKAEQQSGQRVEIGSDPIKRQIDQGQRVMV